MRDWIVKTAATVAFVAVAAMAADYVVHIIVLRDPRVYTPLSTLVIALVVATPLAAWLTFQRARLDRMRDDLTTSLDAQRRAVEEAQDAVAKYREADRLYRLLGDNLTDHVALWSPKGERIYSSPSITRITGYSHEEFMALPPTAMVSEADFKRVQKIIASLTPGGEPQSADYQCFRKDGTSIWLESAYSVLGDGSGILLATSRDITERKRLELDIAKALEAAETASAAKSDFLANMTHELRTPLTAIIGFAEVLRRSRDLSPTAGRQVGHILDASNTLLSVVNDVLDFSRLEAGGLELDPAPFDPAAMASSCAALVEERATAKGLVVAVKAASDLAPMNLDGPRLSQVLLNFLSNAVKFTAQGSITVSLSQTVEGDAAVLRAEVKDTGIGIAPEHRDNIFDRFSQADAAVSRRFGGTGLGLAISRRIIERMDGKIGVDSVEGQGSTFWFEVRGPLAELAAPETDAPPPLNADAGVRLLLVEDNAVNRELIRTMLEPFGVEVETANDGVAGVEAMRRGGYDLVLMDVQMPVMDGLTATREIRAMEGARGAATPIIAMTANVLPEQIANCLAAGMDDHLGKPISPTKLLEAVARWSGRTHAV
ncbi:PAS domain-containing hybrid sensor histidine kinase/response regulator [uncultured Caulobacter sp.]|uniref:PAS domain-containing hybrid sensor histidine kinase/response regulator n=1 Tax=uncultured Caulobacter sp. TaxID=158749 RepID=UPI00263452F0|nr:PAS domain-containing hybrid sensor histidine kinase/response regulator [uncultured Caulobacter sp.]